MNKFVKKIFLPILALLLLASCSDFFNDAKKSASAPIVVPPNPDFTITVPAETERTERGIVKADKTTAKEGQSVSLEISIKSGYELILLDVVAGDGSFVTLEGSGTERTFKMPAQNVEVKPVFVAFAATGEYKDEGNDLVSFGLWPQTKKADGLAIYERASKTEGCFTYCRGDDGQWYSKFKDEWFKVERVFWRVLETDSGGHKLLLAEKIL